MPTVFDRSSVLVLVFVVEIIGIFGSVRGSVLFTGAGIDTFGSGSLFGKSSLLGSIRASIAFAMIIG